MRADGRYTWKRREGTVDGLPNSGLQADGRRQRRSNGGVRGLAP